MMIVGLQTGNDTLLEKLESVNRRLESNGYTALLWSHCISISKISLRTIGMLLWQSVQRDQCDIRHTESTSGKIRVKETFRFTPLSVLNGN